MQEIRFALRSFLKQPGFTLTAVLTLALAIGANTAIFSLVDAVLLTPPPYRDPGRVAVIWDRNPEVTKLIGFEDLPATPATISDWQRDSQSFDKLAEVQPNRLTLTGQGEPTQLSGVQVTGDFFPLLGVSALVGRTLAPADDCPVPRPRSCSRTTSGSAVSPGSGAWPAGRFWAIPWSARWRPWCARNGDPRALASAVRQAVSAVDRNQPVSHILPLTKVVEESIAKSRFSLLLLSFLAVLSLVLAVVGIYGITAYSVAQRTREIGLRMALGARRSEVLQLVVKETGLLAAIGIVLGVALALGLTRTAASASYLSSLLFGVTSTDPTTFAAVAAALVLAALAAAYLPGRRATQVSPMVALRND